MRILIITDSIQEWANDISRYLNRYMNSIKIYEHSAKIQNRLFEIHITDSAETCSRRRYTNIIIDKFVNDELLEQIKAHQIDGMVYTKDYYSPVDYNKILRGET